MLLENIYQIRGSTGVGPFGNDWTIKFCLVFVCLAFCFWDQRTKKRNDYWWIFIVGSLLWGGAEALLQLTGIRQILPRILFGTELPLWISISMQGIVEGALIGVGCTFYGDRILDRATRKKNVLLFTIWMGILFIAALVRPILEGYSGPNYGGEVISRRNMFSPLPVILLCVMIGISVLFYIWASEDLRNRVLLMFILMLIFGTVWTFGEWIAGTRWIEVGIPPNFTHAPPVIEFWALTWDVVVEIAFAYVPFFAIPGFLKLIKNAKKSI